MEGFALQFGLVFVVPVMVGLQMCDITLYKEFINGNNSKPMINVLTSDAIGAPAFEKLLSKGESYYYSNDGATVVKLENKLQAAYDAIFVNSNDYLPEKTRM